MFVNLLLLGVNTCPQRGKMKFENLKRYHGIVLDRWLRWPSTWRLCTSADGSAPPPHPPPTSRAQMWQTTLMTPSPTRLGRTGLKTWVLTRVLTYCTFCGFKVDKWKKSKGLHVKALWHVGWLVRCFKNAFIAAFVWREYCSIKNEVDQLFRAQLFHDRKQYEERRRMKPDERAKTPVVEAWAAFRHKFSIVFLLFALYFGSVWVPNPKVEKNNNLNLEVANCK